MRLDPQESADEPQAGGPDESENVGERPVAQQMVEYVGPSPAGCPMYWYTSPDAGLSSGRLGDSAKARRLRRQADALDAEDASSDVPAAASGQASQCDLEGGEG